jgi:hypothetical protein
VPFLPVSIWSIIKLLSMWMPHLVNLCNSLIFPTEITFSLPSPLNFFIS